MNESECSYFISSKTVLLRSTTFTVRFLTVLRLDLVSGTSGTVFSTLFPRADPQVYERMIFLSERSRLRIGNEVVVAWSPGTFIVGNWRTGKIVIVEEHVSRLRFWSLHV